MLNVNNVILGRVGQPTSLKPIQLAPKMWMNAKKTNIHARRIHPLSVRIRGDRLLVEIVLLVNM